ncbi:hypothetical protein TWF102_000639 [Orbilia oligospora]|uniref:Uncharacterized protein n=1 Tax=Orbilia oligospora TaxID=2813651 RepID=A0A7C8NMG2_ORBOL|nr:hypothetical protein TWF102_000639 [Orbilia oligospora]KAF3099436.1 hypothetical protein TWF706_006536 [Orbilia oligospora]KAF3112369.1 hypothetical protein TWF103_003159 [Orbilia oligospora]KAF3120173.1 hypothetical protein TWF703_002721 [Orbilia oligospora]KAF3136005.1 hypothetical protein TWF594_007980 [Orbilia oligospora]
MASLFSQSVTAASNFYSTAMSSLNTIPTLLPAAPASPIDFSLYTSQIFNSQLPFSFGLVQSIPLNFPPITIPLPLQNLTFWQVANIVFFIFTVGVLSWMLDSHHSDDDDELAIKSKASTTPPPIVIPNTVEILTPPPPRARRQTLETIATFVNFEDIQRSARRRRSLRSPLPCSLFNSPIDNSPTTTTTSSSSVLSSTTISPPPTSPTSTADAHGQLISTPLGKGKSLLRKASENSSCRNRNRRRYSFQDEVVRRGLEVVADYDRNGIVSTEEADQRRSGSWRTGLLLGLRIPVGWTMK